MPNILRGEVEVKVGEEVILLRPTFEGLIEVESRAGCTLFEIAEQIQRSRSPTVKQIIGVLYGGAYGAASEREKPNFAEFADKILAQGLTKFHQPVLTFIMNVFSAREKKTEEQ